MMSRGPARVSTPALFLCQWPKRALGRGGGQRSGRAGDSPLPPPHPSPHMSLGVGRGCPLGPHLTAAWELDVGPGADTKGHSFRSSRSSTASWEPERRIRRAASGDGASRVHGDGRGRLLGPQVGRSARRTAGRKPGGRAPGLVLLAVAALGSQDGQGLVVGRAKGEKGDFSGGGVGAAGEKNRGEQRKGPVVGQEMRLPLEVPPCCPNVLAWGTPGTADQMPGGCP